MKRQNRCAVTKQWTYDEGTRKIERGWIAPLRRNDRDIPQTGPHWVTLQKEMV